jgi:alkylation response protein AidB-like acyl-CoA dehydrogenase
MTTTANVPLTAELVLDDLSPDERRRAARVEEVLPELRSAAAGADADGQFHVPHVKLLSEAGLLGLIVPERYGGLGGTLRDLTAATFAMGTACPSTALAFFFHCSSASRGLLPLEAIDAGLFDDEEAPAVRAFAEKVLTRMGAGGEWLANFASESVKTSTANVTIATEAMPVEGGWRLNGVKSFGCATGVADRYLVTAKRAGSTTAADLCCFFVEREAPGVSERQRWDAIGMRATATHGIVLQDVFVADDEALTLPDSFVKMLQVSRGSFVGNQLAATAVYVGAAQAVFDHAVTELGGRTFADTGQSLASTGHYAQLVGQMARDLGEAHLWLGRQLALETSTPPLRSKGEVIKQWRLAKGSICESAFAVAVSAMKACGTSSTGFSGPISRGVRDLSMGLVQAFPAEKGRLEAAEWVVGEGQVNQFGVRAT